MSSETMLTDAAGLERALLIELATGAGVSAVVGVGAWLAGRRGRGAVRAFGRQTLAWAAVDGALAAGGLLAARRRGGPTPAGRVRLVLRVLRVNQVLDAGYLAGGVALVARPTARAGRGDGLAIATQGAFLLWLDSRHAGRFAAASAADGR